MGGKLPLDLRRIQKRFAGIGPHTASTGWLDQPIFHQQANGVFSGSHAHMVEPVRFATSDILLAHPSQRDEQFSFIIRHVRKLLCYDVKRNVRDGVGCCGTAIGMAAGAREPLKLGG